MPAIDEFLIEIVNAGSSDLHVSSMRPPMMRLQGEMKIMRDEPLDPEMLKSWLIEIMPEHYRKEFESDNDTDFAYQLKELGHRFRVNIFCDHGGVGGVFRHIPSELPTFDQIALEEGALNLCNLHKGLVLVTGPTGSGKSTTLAAMISHITQTTAGHVVTVEDPIEFVYPVKRSLIHQRELHTHTESFGDALRAILRQDPDIILVGEMRDPETTKMAIEAAETGHLVFATLHTNTAISTITRIIYQFGEEEQELIRSMLAENLKGVICQTLMRREDAKGGRIAAREIMVYTVGGANLIRENKLPQLQSVIDGGSDLGMMSLNHSLVNMVSDEIISPESAWRYSLDRSDMEGRLQRIGINIKSLVNDE